jgi:hypothetical protein
MGKSNCAIIHPEMSEKNNNKKIKSHFGYTPVIGVFVF